MAPHFLEQLSWNKDRKLEHWSAKPSAVDMDIYLDHLSKSAKKPGVLKIWMSWGNDQQTATSTII